MVAFIVFLGIIFGGVKLLAIANNISDNEAMDKYSGKLFVVGIIVFVILMCVIGYNDCEDKTKVPISSIKSVLYSLKRKGFISNYKDKHNNNIKGCYVIK